MMNNVLFDNMFLIKIFSNKFSYITSENVLMSCIHIQTLTFLFSVPEFMILEAKFSTKKEIKYLLFTSYFSLNIIMSVKVFQLLKQNYKSKQVIRTL